MDIEKFVHANGQRDWTLERRIVELCPSFSAKPVSSTPLLYVAPDKSWLNSIRDTAHPEEYRYRHWVWVNMENILYVKDAESAERAKQFSDRKRGNLDYPLMAQTYQGFGISARYRRWFGSYVQHSFTCAQIAIWDTHCITDYQYWHKGRV